MKTNGGELSTSTLHRSRSANRVLGLLDVVVASGPVSLTAAAAELDLPASTALRHLRVLAEAGYVTKTDFGHYAVGPTFLRLAIAAWRQGPYAQLIAAAQPILDELAQATGESAYLAVRDGREAVYIATAEGTRAIRHVGWVGRSVPVEGTAVGEALVAATANDPPRAFVNKGASESDVTAVVVPVSGVEGTTGALSILGPSARLKGRRRDEIERGALAAAAELMVALRRGN